MSLQYELFQLANSPQAKLSREDRILFDFYVANAEQYAALGSLRCEINDSVPECVLNALTVPYNGFKISTESDDKMYLDWSEPSTKSFASKLKEKAADPYQSLTRIEQYEYEMFKIACFNKANVGEISIEIPDGISPKVLNALGIPKNSKYFYWGSPKSD